MHGLSNVVNVVHNEQQQGQVLSHLPSNMPDLLDVDSYSGSQSEVEEAAPGEDVDD